MLKTFRLQPVILILTVMLAILWIWIVSDAHKIAKQEEQITLGVMFLVVGMFFMLGWQIGEINPKEYLDTTEQKR